MPRVTYGLLAATLATYAIGAPESWYLWPLTSPEFEPWQMLTYALVHANAIHLIFNSLALLSFGPAVERAWGSRMFLFCYVLAASVGASLQSAVAERPTVGASAALMGLMAAWVMSKPRAKLVTLWPVPVTAWKLLVVFVVLSVLALVFGWMPEVAHLAHLGGACVGFVFAINNKPRQ